MQDLFLLIDFYSLKNMLRKKDVGIHWYLILHTLHFYINMNQFFLIFI